jgi:uncharacterized protein YndB with AHSA1/START domain
MGIAASPKAIYQALTDVKKLAGWWTTDTRGSGSKKGDVIEFWFGEHCQPFRVTALKAGKLVRWKANLKRGVSDWENTEIIFKLTADKGQCWVHFSHAGWKSNKGMFPHCSMKWAVFMLSLKNLLEKGKGQPFPKDLQINHD